MGIKKTIKDSKGVICSYWYIETATYQNYTERIEVILTGYIDETYRIKDKEHRDLSRQYNRMCEKGIDYTNEEEVLEFSRLGEIVVPEYTDANVLEIKLSLVADTLDLDTLYNKIKELPEFEGSLDV